MPSIPAPAYSLVPIVQLEVFSPTLRTTIALAAVISRRGINPSKRQPRLLRDFEVGRGKLYADFVAVDDQLSLMGAKLISICRHHPDFDAFICGKALGEL
jgi:hypothetical protein